MHQGQKRDCSRIAPGKTYCPLALATPLGFAMALAVPPVHDSALPKDPSNSSPVLPWRCKPNASHFHFLTRLHFLLYS